MSDNETPAGETPRGQTRVGKFGWFFLVIGIPLFVWAVFFQNDDDEESASSSSDSGSSGSMSLSEAWCSDLESGLTPMNILGGMVKDGTYTPEQAADRAYGFAANSCPDQLKTNESLRAYLESWNISPDA